MSKKMDLQIPNHVEKAMGITTDDEQIEELREEYPNARILQWSKIAASAWYYLSSFVPTNATYGVFPPSLIIDRIHRPVDETGYTNASLHMVWNDGKNEKNQLIFLIPTQSEVRVYERNVLDSIRSLLQRSIPTTALIAYMMHIIMHEYIHFIDFYASSYRAWEAHDISLHCSDKKDMMKKTELWLRRTNELSDWVSNKSEETAVFDELATEKFAIIHTLNHLALDCFDISDIERLRAGCDILPDGLKDRLLRRRGNDEYNAGSLMCSYLWAETELNDKCVDEDEHPKLLERQREDIKLLKQYGKGMSKTKLILLG